MKARGSLIHWTSTIVAIASLSATAPLLSECPEASFGPAVTVPDATGPVVSGDFDGDGLRNEVAAASDGFLRVYRREASGALTPFGAAEMLVPRAVLVHALDLNGDGLTDVVVSGVAGEGFVSLVNTTTRVVDGYLFSMTSRKFGAQGSRLCRSVASGDVDGDGFADLVASFPTGSPEGASLFLGNGNGTFKPETSLFSDDYTVSDVALGDVNGDDALDLVAVVLPPSFLTRLGNGHGGFDAPRVVEVLAGNPFNPDPQGLALADLNVDGHLDVVVGSYKVDPPSQKLFAFPGVGDGTFGPSQSAEAGPNPTSLAVVDVNRDGLPDLVVGNVTGRARPTVSFLVAKRNGGFGPVVSRSTVLTVGVALVALGDLDADGAPEVLANGTLFPNTCAAPPPVRVVPIVLDVDTGSARYSTELALTNRSEKAATAHLTYTAALGGRAGSGSTSLALAPGEQRRIGDVVSFLRSAGLPIPPASADPQQGGSLRVEFQGDGIGEPQVAATARTSSPTASPLPVGRAGLAYTGVPPSVGDASGLVLFPLRSVPDADRTNLAVFNTSAEAVTFRVTLASATAEQKTVTFREAETLGPNGWVQYGSDQLLAANGLTTAWARIVRTSPGGSLSAYAVVNDAVTNDGSFVPPVAGGGVASSYLTVPVLVETGTFLSELYLLNTSPQDATATIRYVESASPASGPGGTFTLALPAGRGQNIPSVFDFLRSRTSGIGPADGTTHVGSLRLDVAGVAASAIVAGVRVAARTPDGRGQFGLYVPAVYGGEEAREEAFLYGLRSDGENRTNVAAANTGSAGAGSIDVTFQAYDGNAGGAPAGPAVKRSLAPGGWVQLGSFLRDASVTNGWVRVARTKGSAPWVAYGVINDGAAAAERTGDGAYVPMVK